MARLQRVHSSMFDEIYSGLLRAHDPTLTKEQWRRIFTYGWHNPDGHVGYALVDDGAPVGFVGLIFSEMVIDGTPEKFCNVTSWVVNENYEASAAALVLPLRELKEHTITNLTSNLRAYRVFSRLGFEILETHTRLALSVPGVVAPSRFTCTVVHEPDVIAPKLDEAHARILHDHLPYAQHLWAVSDFGACYVVYSHVRNALFNTVRIQYVSDAEHFVVMWPHIQRSLHRRHRCWLAECDQRFTRDGKLAYSLRRRLPLPRLFKSARLRADQITGLYSEMVLLNL